MKVIVIGCNHAGTWAAKTLKATDPNCQVVTYDRNYVSNEMLRQHGLKVLETISSELSRGRGGPRCMSMPLVREDLK